MKTLQTKHVFGPVPSRRLGRSLGVDAVPLKTCNFSCVYCQLGRTRRRQLRRRSFVNVADVVAEIASVLARHTPDTIDWITFVGSGETTLYARLGTLIRFVKSMTDIPVAVITNGSLLHLPRVQRELEVADAVLTGLDAGSESLFRAVNRPHPTLSFDRHVNGLVEFGQAYGGRLWVEVMLIDGVNDSDQALTEVADVLSRVGPEEIHIITPSRPPAEPWVRSPTDEAVDRAVAILGEVARAVRPVASDAALDLDDDLVDAVFNIIARHPLGETELERLLCDWASGKVADALQALQDSGKVQVVRRSGRRFWCAAGLEFPDEIGPRIDKAQKLQPARA
jgi:wyosine [tRNA(Phe)-imidazoG37] synthetase (radical SAM superfamily)